MTDTPNGYRALPWHSDGYRVFDADGIEVANTFTPELALGSAKAVAKDIVEAANAHYVGKDARIAELEEAYEEAAQDAAYVHELTDRAEASEEYVRELSAALKKANKRAEAAEKRAEQAEIDRSELLKYYERYRVRELERQTKEAGRNAEWAINRMVRAEARVRELEKTHAPDTFTAPDGRVFRVGQWVNVHHPSGHRSSGWVVSGPNVHRVDWVAIRAERDPENEWGQPMANLRRVWDGTEEPDVPVGTVLRDAYGLHLERLSGTRWELQNEKGDPLDKDEWDNLDAEQFRPYVEVLPGDDD